MSKTQHINTKMASNWIELKAYILKKDFDVEASERSASRTRLSGVQVVYVHQWGAVV